VDNQNRLYARNWQAVNDRMQQIDAEHDELTRQVVALEARLTSAVSQVQEAFGIIQSMRAERFGTGPSARK